MIHRLAALPPALLLLLLPLVAPAATLKGKVELVGTQDELTPAEGVMVTLEETGDTERSKAGGLFNLPLPDAFGPGERITLQVEKEGWRIQYPLDGEVRVPRAGETKRVSVRLLPVGSRKWWSDDRIEKLIADTAARAKEQVVAEGDQRPPDFSRYIKEWAIEYGFSAEQAQAQIERWVAEVKAKEKDDFYKLGLAAFAETNFVEAQQLFRESAQANAERMRASEQALEEERERFEDYREATVRDYRLAGDAAYNNYSFAEALDAYREAIALTDRDEHPRKWAAITIDVGRASHEIGIRTTGLNVQKMLAEAVGCYRAALEVYPRDQAPQDWAMTQNNPGFRARYQG
ncbi:MAG: hypothetical protein AAFX85_18950, partial [Pseudomonadota bacterium]